MSTESPKTVVEESQPATTTEATAPTKKKVSSKSDNLIVLSEQEGAEQLARDINHKIDSMESHFEKLTDVFSNSQEIFKSSMEGLQTRSTSLAEDIQQLSSAMEEGFSKQSSVTTALEERMLESVDEFNQQIDRATKALHFQDTRIDELQLSNDSLREQMNESVEELGERLESNANSIGQQKQEIELIQAEQQSLIELQKKLDAASESHGIKIKSLADKTKAQFADNQEHILHIKALLDDHQGGLDDLLENYRSVESKADALNTKLSEVEIDLNSHQKETKKRFKLVHYVGGGITALLVGGIVALQYYPIAVPTSIQTQFDELTQSFSNQSLKTGALSENLDTVKNQQFSLEANIKDISASVVALNQDLTKTENGQTRIQQQQDTNTSQISQIDDSVKQLQKSVDDLDFKILGPGVASEAKLNDGITLNDSDWIAAQNGDSYSIQLLGVYRFSHLVSFLNKNENVIGDQPVSYNVGQRIGKDWFNLYYGSYGSFDEAQAALDSLPLRLKVSNPWIRQFSAIQKTK